MRFSILLLFLSTQVVSKAQGWRTRHLLEPYTDFTRCVFETTPNNYIGIGDKVDINGNTTMCVMGLNAQGQLLWTKEYRDSTLTYGQGLDSYFGYKQGNYIYYTRYAKYNQDTLGVGLFLKFDFNGDTIWQKIFHYSLGELVPQQLTGSVDGGFLITGCFINLSNNTTPGMILKTDANGNELWRKEIHKTGADIMDGKAIVQDSASKKIIIVGFQAIGHDLSGWNTAGNILILDSLGNKLLQKSYTGNIGGVWTDVIQTKDKNFIAIGKLFHAFDSYGEPIGTSYACKFNINGSLLWWFDYTEPPNENFFTTGALSHDDGIVILGCKVDTSENKYNGLMKLTKINNNGKKLWEHYYDYRLDTTNPMGLQKPCSLNPTSDNGFIAAIELFSPQPAPFLFVKYDENGCDTTLTYCAATYTWTGMTTRAASKIKLSTYPNPVSGIVIVELPKDRIYNVRLSNSLGLVCKEISLANLKEEIDLSLLSPGIYLLQVYEQGYLVAAQKLIKD